MKLVVSCCLLLAITFAGFSHAADSQSASWFESVSKKKKLIQEKYGAVQEQIKSLREKIYDTRVKQVVRKYDKAIDSAVKSQNFSNAEAVKLLEVFVQNHPDEGELTASALLSLGEHYFNEVEARFLANDELQTLNFNKAIVVYSRLLKHFPNFKYIDVAYYRLGICYAYEEKLSKAISIWQELIDLFPDSQLNSEVWFRLGEAHFKERKFEAALENYLQVIDTKSAFYIRALYKTSWTYYILNQFEDAIESFIQVLDFQELHSAKLTDTALLLKKEAEEYLAICFVDIDIDVSSQYSEVDLASGIANLNFMTEHFAQIGNRGYERNVLVYLGNVLVKLAKYEGAQAAYYKAISLDPLNAQNPELLSRIIKFKEENKNIAEAMKVRGQIVADYAPGSVWQEHFKKEGKLKDLSKAQVIVQDALLKLALYDHSQYVDIKAKASIEQKQILLESSIKKYINYIKWFYNSDDIAEIMLYLAEANFELRRYIDAAFAFEQVRDWPWETKYRPDAAVDVVFSYRKEVEKLQKQNKLPSFDLLAIHIEDKGSYNGRIPETITKWVESINLLQKLYPKDKELPTFLFEAAGIFYRYGQTDEAERRFAEIIKLYPNLKVAHLSAHLVLEEKIATKDWAEVAKQASQFKAAKIGNSVKDFNQIEINSKFKEAQVVFENAHNLLAKRKVLDATAEFKIAAGLFLGLLKQAPTSEFADKMLYNAAQALDKSRDGYAAFLLYQRFVKEFPASSYRAESLLKIAGYYEASLSIQKAAFIYIEYVSEYPKAANRSQALLNAALLFEANHDYRTCLRYYKQFALEYKDSADLAEVKNKILFLEERNKGKKASVAFNALQKEFKSFQRLKINAASGKSQSNQLVRKTKMLASLQKKYDKIATEFPDSKWGLAALYQIGVLYENLHGSLIKAPCPKDVKEQGLDACDEYTGLLEDKAFVLEQKAVQAFRLVSAKSYNVEDLGDWVQKSKKALQRMKVDENLPTLRPVFSSKLYVNCLGSYKKMTEKALLSLLLKDPEDFVARFAVVQHFLKKDKFQAALTALRDMEALHGKNPCLVILLSKLDYQQVKWKELLGSISRAAKLVKNNESLRNDLLVFKRELENYMADFAK